MKVKTFQLKDILPNPFRDFKQNPLSEEAIEGLVESIRTTNFWENQEVRINKAGDPELVYGHHTLAALRRIYPGTKEFDWKVVSLNDGAMIQKMARENATQRKTTINMLFEAIKAAVATYGAGLISVGDGVGEIHPVPHTKPEHFIYAPNYSSSLAAKEDTKYPYTMQTLATFLGFVQPDGQLTTSFGAAFGALELIKEGYLTEIRIRDLEPFKLASVVSVVKQQRAKALEDAKRLAAEAEARKQEAIRKEAELVKQKAEAETRRKAAAEAERLAAIKRAEVKAAQDAAEKIRREAEEKRKKIEAEQRAAAEAKRKEEEERQRKIREAQRAEAEKQRVEAEKVRQAALAKSKKEADERKAAQMVKDAEAAKVRAEAEAKRKEESARQAEVAAKKRAEEEKERQAAAAKKRAEEDARQAAQRKAQKEEADRKEAQRAEAARLKVIADKKAADESARKKQEEIDQANAEAKKKEAEAKREQAEAKAQVKAVADEVADKVKNMTRKDIRADMGDIASEASHNAAVKIGRKPVSFSSSGSVSVSEDKLKKFMDAIKSNPRVVLSGKCIPRTVVIAARELVSAGRKVLAAKRHPDTGGSEEEMRVLNAATQWLTLLISQNEEK